MTWHRWLTWLAGVAVLLASCGGDSKSTISAGSPTSTLQTATTPATRPASANTPESRPAATRAPPPPTQAPVTLPAATSSPAPVTQLPASSPSSSSSSGSTAVVEFPFKNADQAVRSLLGTARFGAPMDALDSMDALSIDAYPGWRTYYPTMHLAGSSTNATPDTVSVYRGTLTGRGAVSPGNPKLIAFAVMDSAGKCAAAAIKGFPAYNDYNTLVDIGSMPCNAQSALNVLRR